MKNRLILLVAFFLMPFALLANDGLKKRTNQTYKKAKLQHCTNYKPYLVAKAPNLNKKRGKNSSQKKYYISPKSSVKFVHLKRKR